MINSMTGFARKSITTQSGTITCEVRSVNHRFLEIFTRIPDFLRELEIPIRNFIQQQLKRGKIEAFFTFNNTQSSLDKLKLNEALIDDLSKINKKMGQHFPDLQLELTQLLNWPGVVQTQELDFKLLQTPMLDLLSETLSDLKTARQREGSALKTFLRERLSTMEKRIEAIELRIPEILAKEQVKIRTRFADLKLELDPDRLAQEMVWLTQRMDIQEEMNRLKIHIQEIKRVLDHEAAAGRRLDFLMQELNREANTMASKSLDAPMTQVAVDLKVIIEQMREQVQNIE